MRFFDLFPIEKTILKEWRGIPARNPGETYVNPKDPTDILTLVGKVQPFPDPLEGKIKFDSVDECAVLVYKKVIH